MFFDVLTFEFIIKKNEKIRKNEISRDIERIKIKNKSNLTFSDFDFL